MSERRKPAVKIRVTKTDGRKVKIELFKAILWVGKKGVSSRLCLDEKYRVRVDGKWASFNPDGGQYQFVTLWEFRDKFFQSLKNMIK